jgi:hypothetical protein
MGFLRDRRTQDRAVAAFHSRIGELRQDGIYKDYLDNRLPWAEAEAADKLEAIVMAAQYAPPDDGPALPGRVALQAIEYEVEDAGLPAVQREMLRDVRARIAAGQLDGPYPKHRMDRAWMALRNIVAAGEFERKLELHTQDDRWWAGLTEDCKAGMIVEVGLEAGAPGAHTLGAIERGVNYGGLSPWRREALQDVRMQHDRGELHGDDAGPVYRGDRVHTALRLAEFKSRIEDYKQAGVSDDGRSFRRWSELSEKEKLGRMTDQAIGLYLGFEPRTYEIISREVDMTHVPGERRREAEGSQLANGEGHAERDALLRETYRLNHELGYIGFRHQYLNDPDAIKEWPDPAVRERELRKFWDNEQKDSFPSYCNSHSNESLRVLSAYRDCLRGLLAGDRGRQIAYYYQVSEIGRSIRLSENGFSQRGAAKDRPATPSEIARDDTVIVPVADNRRENGRGR